MQVSEGVHNIKRRAARHQVTTYLGHSYRVVDIYFKTNLTINETLLMENSLKNTLALYFVFPITCVQNIYDHD